MPDLTVFYAITLTAALGLALLTIPWRRILPAIETTAATLTATTPTAGILTALATHQITWAYYGITTAGITAMTWFALHAARTQP